MPHKALSLSASVQRAGSEAELAKYEAVSCVCPSAAVEPLTFWKQNAAQFPILSLTARTVFTARRTIVQSAVLRLHVVRPRLSACNVGG